MVPDCPEEAAWFNDLLGNERFWHKPEKKTDAVVSVNELPELPAGRRAISS
ncbi:hypothetical protein [Paenibacillus elgii]|uniref:hypothetical protein n=1 Tax=Paenibacillus elgii TaxID=189691 RepID=UPI0027B92DEC|nr:hypothetical protein [Paenibacillus elgii]